MLEQDREYWGLCMRYVSSSRLGSEFQDGDEELEEEEDRLEEDLLVKLWRSSDTLGCACG